MLLQDAVTDLLYLYCRKGRSGTQADFTARQSSDIMIPLKLYPVFSARINLITAKRFLKTEKGKPCVYLQDLPYDHSH